MALIAILSCFEAIAAKPDWIYPLAAALLPVIFLLIRQGIRQRKRNVANPFGGRKAGRRIATSLLLFIFGALLFFLFIQSAFLKQLLIFVAAAFSFSVMKEAFPESKKISFAELFGNGRSASSPEEDPAFPEAPEASDAKLENMLDYLDLLAYFFIFSFFFGLNSFLSLPVWLIFFPAALACWGLGWRKLKGGDIPRGKIFPYSLAMGLVTAEIFLGILFLPISFYVKGFAMTLIGRLAADALFFYAPGQVGRRRPAWLRLIFGGILLGIVILTAKWH